MVRIRWSPFPARCLVVELVILGGAAAAPAAANRPSRALIFAALIVIDYVACYDRVARLLTGA